MAKVQRSTDIVETIAERAFFYGLGGAVLGATGGVLLAFKGDGLFVPLAYILLGAGALLLLAAVYAVTQVRKVTSYLLNCPYCEVSNSLLEQPEDDFVCVGCHRMIPVSNKLVMAVMQVKCGFCEALNFYCDKTEILICETCDHEIPISQEGVSTKVLPKGYALKDDDSLYELVLAEAGAKDEEIISTLQQMLALNRNQVKDILNQLPCSLLTGINRRKAEMLQAQLSVHGGKAEIKVLTV